MIDAAFAELQANERVFTRKEAINLAMQEAGKGVALTKAATRQDQVIREPFLSGLFKRFHPYINHTLQYDDNVETDYEVIRATMISNMKPGLKMSYRGRKWSLQGDFNYQNKFYDNLRNSNFDQADGLLQSSLNLGRNVLTLFNQLTYFHPAKKDFGGVDDDVITAGKNYRKNDFKASLGRGFNRFGYDLIYNRIDYKYEPAFESSNYHEQEITFRPYWRISKKTRITGAYVYNFQELTDVAMPDDRRFQKFSMTFFNRLTAKISDEVIIEQQLTDKKRTNDEKFTSFRSKFAYGFSPRTNLTLDLSHKIYRNANRQANYLEDIYEFSGNHRFAFNPKIRLSLGAKTTLTDYIKRFSSSVEQKTDVHLFTFSLDYAFRKWLDFVLSYNHKINNSTVRENDYNQNIFTFSTEARF